MSMEKRKAKLHNRRQRRVDLLLHGAKTPPLADADPLPDTDLEAAAPAVPTPRRAACRLEPDDHRGALTGH